MKNNIKKYEYVSPVKLKRILRLQNISFLISLQKYISNLLLEKHREYIKKNFNKLPLNEQKELLDLIKEIKFK